MPTHELPERPSLEYLKKLAKDRLRQLRDTNPAAKLAAAQLAIAREYGFPSWRSLKAKLAEQQIKGDSITLFFEACRNGDTRSLEQLLAADPSLAHAANPKAPHNGWTGLHEAARQGHVEAVHTLLARGADPNAREAGDNTYPLHWATAQRHNEVIGALLDAGADVQGEGDVHALDVIGWGTFFREPGAPVGHKPETAALLEARGARHHVFSALSVGDANLVRRVVSQNPSAVLARRMSRYESELTPLHFALQMGRHDLLRLLIELGADLDAKDKSGMTVLESAILQGNREAVRDLLAAGAAKPRPARYRTQRTLSKAAGSVRSVSPMIYVPDVASTLDWYVSLGFEETGRFEDDGHVNFGSVRLGHAEILINMNGKRGEHDVSLWFNTDRVDEMYARLKARQIGSVLGGDSPTVPAPGSIEFVEPINDTFYGARQFAIRDPNGYILYFIQ
jgi:ankyrin repeat protein/catechol 2,3-dioxygenase-like lactoylglutathione lyase family enzyme